MKFQAREDSFAHKIELDEIATVSTRPLYAKQNQAYAMELLVPPTPPTDETSSAICKVHYFLAVMHFTFTNFCFPFSLAFFPFEILNHSPRPPSRVISRSFSLSYYYDVSSPSAYHFLLYLLCAQHTVRTDYRDTVWYCVLTLQQTLCISGVMCKNGYGGGDELSYCILRQLQSMSTV